MTHRNVIFDILESHVLQRYSTHVVGSFKHS